MRILVVLILAVAVTGCAALRKKTSAGDQLPEAWHPHEHSKVDDTHRASLHSNDPSRDKY